MPFVKGVTPKGAKPWKKGQSGNPAGRQKLPDIKEALARALGGTEEGLTYLDTILRALRNKAEAGDVRAAEVLLDRAFGKPTQPTDVTSGGEPIRVMPPIVWSDEGEG